MPTPEDDDISSLFEDEALLERYLKGEASEDEINQIADAWLDEAGEKWEDEE